MSREADERVSRACRPPGSKGSSEGRPAAQACCRELRKGRPRMRPPRDHRGCTGRYANQALARPRSCPRPPYSPRATRGRRSSQRLNPRTSRVRSPMVRGTLARGDRHVKPASSCRFRAPGENAVASSHCGSARAAGGRERPRKRRVGRGGAPWVWLWHPPRASPPILGSCGALQQRSPRRLKASSSNGRPRQHPQHWDFRPH